MTALALAVQIRQDDPRRPEVTRLLRGHLDEMRLHSPPESIHALDVEGLCRPEITFWTASEGAELVGCGALRELDPDHAEIKSMRTAPAHRRKGVAAAMLRHLVDEARRRGYRRLSLETGSMEAFVPARRLYARFGFQECGPFAGYALDPNSAFLTLAL